MFVDKETTDTRGWMKLVAMKNFPLLHVDDPIVRDAVRFSSMSKITLMSRMTCLVDIMENDIRAEVAGKKFVLIFDGFTDAAEHLLCVFIATNASTRFLSFSSFEDESSMTAAEHINFLDLIMEQYGLKLDNLVAIVADNMATNKAISKRIKGHLLGVLPIVSTWQ
ncbi:hypothetical protein LEN26_002116 [Aphanomyces euteiches]|nr:hypothetical protein LEN26_002116 [Aphanomyces euteiches]